LIGPRTVVGTAAVNEKSNLSSFYCFRFSVLELKRGTCDHFVALSLNEGLFLFHL